MANGIPKRDHQAEQRRKRAQAACGLAMGARKPVAAVPVPSAAKRPSAGLAKPHLEGILAAVGKRLPRRLKKGDVE